LPKLGLISVE